MKYGKIPLYDIKEMELIQNFLDKNSFYVNWDAVRNSIKSKNPKYIIVLKRNNKTYISHCSVDKNCSECHVTDCMTADIIPAQKYLREIKLTRICQEDSK